MSGLVQSEDGTYRIHMCEPPLISGQLPGDRTSEPLGARWKCTCGNEFMVVLDGWGKTWRRVRLARWNNLFRRWGLR